MNMTFSEMLQRREEARQHGTPNTTVTDLAASQARLRQEELDRQKAEFFARGGRIKQCGFGELGAEKYAPQLRTDGLKRL